MREPYQTLLGQFDEHPLIGNYVKGRVPDFEGLYAAAKVWRALSASERLLWDIAMALYTGNSAAKIADLLKLDLENLNRVIQALLLAKWTDVQSMHDLLASNYAGAVEAKIRDNKLNEFRAQGLSEATARTRQRAVRSDAGRRLAKAEPVETGEFL